MLLICAFLILVNNQLDAQFFFRIYLFQFSTCFEHTCAYHQETKLYQYDILYMPLCIEDRLVCRFGWSCSSIQTCIPARPRTQHDCHHDTKVKPEVATAVIELLMMGGKTPETCSAVNKRQDNKVKNGCIRLVIYLK
jgi:hypothetical protein